MTYCIFHTSYLEGIYVSFDHRVAVVGGIVSCCQNGRIVLHCEKGYLFTIGDEEITPALSRDALKKFINPEEQVEYTNEELLALVSKYWHVYHVIVEEGSHATHYPEETKNSWVSVLGQKVIRLKKTENLAEVLVSTLQLANGMTKEEILADWNGSTALATISHAIAELEGSPDDENGLVTIEG